MTPADGPVPASLRRTEPTDLGARVEERLATLEDLPVTEHAEVFSSIHGELTQRLRETER